MDSGKCIVTRAICLLGEILCDWKEFGEDLGEREVPPTLPYVHSFLHHSGVRGNCIFVAIHCPPEFITTQFPLHTQLRFAPLQDALSFCQSW